MAKLKDRYADALFELSEENDSLQEDLEQAILIRDSLGVQDIQGFLQHPNISNSEKNELFRNAFSDKISKHLMGFLYLTVGKNREKLIIPVLEEYIYRINRYFGRIDAKIVSAKALTEKQIESIHKLLAKQTDMQIEIQAKVDPDVIGGFYVLVDGHIFDGTVRSKLKTMTEDLKRGSYE